MQRRMLSYTFLFLLGVSALAADVERVVVRCETGCDRLAAAIEALDGEVTHRYRYIGALAATVPFDHRGALLEHPDATTVFKDAEIAPPELAEPVDIALATGVEPLRGAALGALLEEQAADFVYNTALTGARELHLRGHTGDGVVVAVIGTGVVNRSDHALAGKVIGGEEFSPAAGTGPSATSRWNNPHETMVACLIAADWFFFFPAASPISQSIEAHAPDSIFPCNGVICPLGNNKVPMLGIAPHARLYSIKYFGQFSDLLAAMERPITLKRHYDAGMPSVPVAGDGSEEDPYVYDSLNVRVANMSFGYKTFFAGHELTELLTEKMLDADIVPVVAAGNEGPMAMTLNNPASSRAALSVGAAITVAHARIYYDQVFGPGGGAVAWPADHHRVRPGSARGPTADGRLAIDLVANGFAALVQDPHGQPDLQFGTSLSAPIVAGAAALLQGAVPGASAAEVRGALIAAANPDVLGDGSAPIDRGHGFVDIPAALALLETGTVDTTLPRGTEGATVAGNITSLGFETIRLGTHGTWSSRVEDLRPGQVAHFFVESGKKTDLLRASLRNVTFELPPSQQNAIFGDGIYLAINDAPTSEFDPVVEAYLAEGATFDLPHPQTGSVRIAVAGVESNAGRVSADLVIEAWKSPPAPKIAEGEVVPGELDVVAVTVPPGTEQAVFELSWSNHWGAYPTDDLDLYYLDPAGNLSGRVTYQSPERAVIDDPLPGEWQVGVWGVTVHGVHGSDASHWAVRVTDQDGVTLGESE